MVSKRFFFKKLKTVTNDSYLPVSGWANTVPAKSM